MDVITAVEWLQTLVFGALGVAALRRWITRRSTPAAWLAAAFGSIATVVVVARALPAEPTSAFAVAAASANVAILATFPLSAYLLARSYRERRAGPGQLAVALGVTAVVAVWGAVLAPFPTEAAERTAAHRLFLVAFAVQWTALSGAAVAGLWRAVRGRPRLTRLRMRLLAVGLAMLNVALLGAIAAGPEASRSVTVGVALLAIVSALMSYLSFAPTALLNALLRHGAGRGAVRMQERLLAATTPEEVADALLPYLHQLLGLDVLLVDEQGLLLGVAGRPAEEARRLAGRAAASGSWPSDAVVIDLRGGRLVLPHSRLVPFLSDDEQDLLAAMAGHLDLALERARLLEAEREARAEAELARAEVEKIVFGLAHDLQTPVVAIQAFADLLQRDALDGEERREAAARIGSSAEYTSQLLADLLSFARIGRSQNAPQRVDLAELVRQTAGQLAPTFPGLEVRVVGALPSLYADPTQLRQMFTNLFSNAARHAGREDVRVEVRSEDVESGGVRLVVGDNGRGVPDKHHERIFELFERGDATVRGSGVGLTIVRRLVETLGGRVHLSARTPGAHFVIDLPASLVDPVGPPEPPGRPAGD